jgi:hypothetical protein
MQSRTRIDIVSPATALQQIPTASEAAEHVKQGFEAENVHWYLYPGELPAGLMIVDEDRVVAGPKTASEATEVSGTVYCSDPAIAEWAVDLHESYREESYTPLRYLLRRLQSESTDLLDRVSLKPLS